MCLARNYLFRSNRAIFDVMFICSSVFIFASICSWLHVLSFTSDEIVLGAHGVSFLPAVCSRARKFIEVSQIFLLP